MNSSAQPLRVWIADSNFNIRQTLRLFIEEAMGLSVVGESDSLTTLLSQVQSTCPDLLLIARENLPSTTPAIIQQLRTICPGVKIIYLSSLSASAAPVLTAGVDAFVSKGDPPSQLIETITALCSTEQVKDTNLSLPKGLEFGQ